MYDMDQNEAFYVSRPLRLLLSWSVKKAC